MDEITSEDKKAEDLANRLGQDLDNLLGQDQNALRRVFLGRVGFGQAPTSRSVRRPLETLLADAAS